jgi:hypothetical protein
VETSYLVIWPSLYLRQISHGFNILPLIVNRLLKDKSAVQFSRQTCIAVSVYTGTTDNNKKIHEYFKLQCLFRLIMFVVGGANFRISTTGCYPSRSLACWDCGFKSRRVHESLSFVSVVCCQTSLRRADPSSSGVLPCVHALVCYWVWSGRKITLYTYNESGGLTKIERRKENSNQRKKEHCSIYECAEFVDADSELGELLQDKSEIITNRHHHNKYRLLMLLFLFQ